MLTAHAHPHPSADAPICSARAIEKAFFGHRVVRGVDLDLERGKVHILTGPNGAGKSTLLKILAGVHRADAGSIVLAGRRQRFRGPADARQAGIATVHQELSLVPSLSILDNLMLGREPLWLGQRARLSAAKQARHQLAQMDLDLDLQTPVEALPLGQQQLIEIVRGLMISAEIYLLDEPTSALPRAAAEKLYQQLGHLRRQGCATLLVSHKLDEILALADQISVMRDGKVVWQTANTPTAYSHDNNADHDPELRAPLLAAMAPELLSPAKREAPGPHHRTVATSPGGQTPPRLELTGVSVTGQAQIGPLDLRVEPGEILGLAGLQGSGISMLLHALVGAKGHLTGTRVALDGRKLAFRSPQQARRAGVLLLTCDRKRLGLIPGLGALDNTVLSALDSFTRFAWVDTKRAREAAGLLLARVRLAAADLDAPVTTLSGGNQQKVYLARCLLSNPRLLLLDDPTRGVDIGAKRDLHELIHAHANTGQAVIWAATELTELTHHCDRIVALARGRVTGRFTPPYNTDAVVAATMGDVSEASA